MTTIDWVQAASKAAAKHDQAFEDALGELVLDINELAENNNVPRQFKLEVVTQTGSALKQLLGGQPVSGSPALGGGSGTSGGPTQQQLDDLQDSLNAAVAQNTKLLKDRKILEEIVLDLGETTPADSNTPFATDTANKVKRAIKDKETAAEQKGATNAGMLDSTKVKPLVDEALAAWNTKVDGQVNKRHTVIKDGAEHDKLDHALTELKKLVP